MIGIAILCYAIITYTGYALSAMYAAIISLFYGATTTIFTISLIVTTVAFIYIFKPKTALTYLMWFLISVVYSGIMYLFGESIIIVVVALGILVTVAFLFGEVSFTGILTYRDLKEWVANQNKVTIEQQIESLKSGTGGEFP
jgi:hypothetical protein